MNVWLVRKRANQLCADGSSQEQRIDSLLVIEIASSFLTNGAVSCISQLIYTVSFKRATGTTPFHQFSLTSDTLTSLYIHNTMHKIFCTTTLVCICECE